MSPLSRPAEPSLASALRSSRHGFLEAYQPLRSELHRYCRHLTAAAHPSVAGTLIGQLSPQEHAAVVLKDVLDLSLEEIADALSTTTGAVKAALHRGRGKLEETVPEPERAPAPAVLDAFCAAFNAGDLDRLTSLLLDTASVEVVGATTQYGSEAARRTVLYGVLFGSRRMATADVDGGMEARLMQGVLPAPPRIEANCDRVGRLHNYFFNPDFIADVCGELDVPWRSNGYRWFLRKVDR